MSETIVKNRGSRNPLEGKTLYGWNVLAYEGNHNKKSYYWCRCRCCRQLYLRRADKMLAGRTKRCGECAADHIKYEGEKEKMSATVPKKKRQATYEKYGGRCAYCGEQIKYTEMEVDYLKPVQQGGKMELDNLLPSCRVCKRNRKNRQLDKFRKRLQDIPKTLERDCDYRLGKKYGLVHEEPAPLVQFYFEIFAFEKGKAGEAPGESNLIEAMRTIAAYCQRHNCEDCMMEVNCSHNLEPIEWQMPEIGG